MLLMDHTTLHYPLVSCAMLIFSSEAKRGSCGYLRQLVPLSFFSLILIFFACILLYLGGALAFMLCRLSFRLVHCVVAFHIKKLPKTCYPSTHFLAGATAAIFPQCPVLWLLACHRQTQGCRPCMTGPAAPFRLFTALFLAFNGFISPIQAQPPTRVASISLMLAIVAILRFTIFTEPFLKLLIPGCV